MPIITSLQYKPTGSVRVSLDGDSFLLDGDTAVQFGLRKEMELSEEESEVLHRKAEEYFAYQKALLALSAGDLSEKMLFRRLKDKGATPSAIEKAIAKVKELGFLQEESYASRLCATYSEGKHFGFRRVMQELQKHGVQKEACEEALSHLPEDREVLPLYYEAHLSRTDLSDEKQKRKAFAQLLRAGFGYETINAFFRQQEREG